MEGYGCVSGKGITWMLGVEGSCAYCDTPFDDSQHATGATRDHVIPKSIETAFGHAPPRHGGVVLACGTCNHLKRNYLPQGLREAAEFHRHRADRLDQIAERAEQIIKERKLW